MKLRSQILILLILFGLAPLAVALITNLPLIISSLELFYHKGHLQNLRADFRDLDQHIASRVEMVRLLAKLPEPGVILGDQAEKNGMEINKARKRYTEWINRFMFDQPDIIQILFLDQSATAQFWLERDNETLELIHDANPLDMPPSEQIHAAMRFKPGGVLTSPISINPKAGLVNPTRHMTLRLISPIYAPTSTGYPLEETGPPLGTVVINIDVGGLARVYHDTHWVLDNGNYLRPGNDHGRIGAAFEEFPGLKDIFAEDKLALWKGEHGERVIWVPLFVTEKSGPLWVGRYVDPSPIAFFRRKLELRTGLIIFALIVIILLIARWIALRTERFGQDLIDGIRRVVNNFEAVKFAWSGPQEIQALGKELTQLAKTHAENSAALRAHALELEKSNRYKSQFLANVSHELRTPLNSILLLSKLLAEVSENTPPEEQARQARIIHEAGSDLMTMIDNILDLSRLEAGKMTFNLAEVALPRLLEGLIELFQPQFDAKNLTLNLNVDDDAPLNIISDAEKVSQILKNFLSNAVKFTEQGGVWVTLSRNKAGNNASYPVRLSVRDTGVGIPLDKQRFIFNAFAQADGSTSRRYGGTGLGLSISQELAKLMGGAIELDSEVGRGSNFSLLLPLEFDRDRVDTELINSDFEHSHTRAVSSTLVPQANLGGHKILIVDDELHNLLALTPLLERWGLEVTAAGDGKEAFETLEESNHFDLVLMDIMLPDMDGYETMKHIRELSHSHTIPIIAMSAKVDSANRRKCINSGASDYLTKPIDPSALKDLLEHYLSETEYTKEPKNT